MTTATKQDAPGETGQDLNNPQPDIPDKPGQTVAYAIYHPDHGFAETCTSAIDDFTDHQNEGSAILLFRQRDVAAADRLQRGWSDEAQIIAVRIPEPRQPQVGTVPAQLYAIRSKADGDWSDIDINSEPEVLQVHCFRSPDEAATARLLVGHPEDAIVPLIELSAATDQLAQENRRLKQELAERNRQLADTFKQYRERTTKDDETSEPELEPLPDEDTLIECASAAKAIEDELSWLTEGNVHDAVNREGIRGYVPLRVLLKLIDAFDGDLRIRKTRPEDREPARRLIIEGRHGYNVLPAKAADLTIRVVLDEGFLEYDGAGVLHVTDKGRALIGAK